MDNNVVKISIVNPCSENWANMSATNKGAFCQQCQKEVIDFSKLSDNQIIQLLGNNTGSICGKVKSDQLNRRLNFTKTLNYSQPSYYKFFVGLFVSSFWNNSATAKSCVVESTKPNTYFTEKQLVDVETNETKRDSSKQIIKGKVLDKETNDPIPFANVFIKNYEISVSTDINGNFSLSIPKEVFVDTFSIKISYLGYGLLEIINCTIQDLGNEKNYYLKKDEIAYLGGVNFIYSEPPKKKKWWQRKQK